MSHAPPCPANRAQASTRQFPPRPCAVRRRRYMETNHLTSTFPWSVQNLRGAFLKTKGYAVASGCTGHRRGLLMWLAPAEPGVGAFCSPQACCWKSPASRSSAMTSRCGGPLTLVVRRSVGLSAASSGVEHIARRQPTAPLARCHILSCRNRACCGRLSLSTPELLLPRHLAMGVVQVEPVRLGVKFEKTAAVRLRAILSMSTL